MKVLLAHTYYRSSAPSGEDAVFDNERKLLEGNGIQVIPFIRRNDDLVDDGLGHRISIALQTTWSARTAKDIAAVIHRERPQIAHFHNTFPQISPSAYFACKSLNVPVVQTLHNYRLICAGALLQRKGRPCEDCVGTSLLPGLIHRCYRGSLFATGALTLMLAVNRAKGSYRDNVDRYIALTEFAASRLKAGGLPSERMIVKPNFLPNPPAPGVGQGGYALYVGRLSQEKGVLTLMDAWRRLRGVPLKILGDGPLEPQLRQMVAQERLSVEFLGFRSRQEVLNYMGQAAMLVVPSECYEGFPMVILEAYASGTPVVASRIGSLDEIVEDRVSGLKFTSGDPGSLAEVVQWAMTTPDSLAAMRQGARVKFDRNYTSDKNLQQLIGVYQSALAVRI